MKRIATAVAFATAMNSVAFASTETPSTAELLSMIARMEQRIAKLEKERAEAVRELKAAKTAGPRVRSADTRTTLPPIHQAAPLPAEATTAYAKSAPTPWGGFFVGASLGGARLDGSFSSSGLSISDSVEPTSISVQGTSRRNNGAIFDMFAGYDWKLGTSAVFGLQAEGSISTLSANMDLLQNYNDGAYTSVTSMRLNWMASGLARLGWTPNDGTLLYVNGGWSFAQFQGQYFASSFDLNGPTFGFGAAQKIDANWALLAEYRFTHFNQGSWSERYTGRSGNSWSETNYTNSARVDLHTIRAGIMYQWH